MSDFNELSPFNLLDHLERQRVFSERTFGPGKRTKMVADHIRKELVEIEAKPSDLTEWVDVILLALDGAWRSGATPAQIAEAIEAKQAKNEGRAWPDWRTSDPDRAIEHDRSRDAEAGADDLVADEGAPHPDDEAVDRFAVALKEKMAAARAKGRSGWQQCSPFILSEMLRAHVEKGDPRDVANFCMMLWDMDHSIAAPLPPASNPDGQAVTELQNIVNAKRFDRETFADDTEFADWAQNRARHILARAKDRS